MYLLDFWLKGRSQGKSGGPWHVGSPWQRKVQVDIDELEV